MGVGETGESLVRALVGARVEKVCSERAISWHVCSGAQPLQD